VTDAVVVSVADFGLASVVAARAVDSGFALIDAEPALAAAVVAEPVVAVVSGPDLIFAARAPAAAGLVSAFVLAAVAEPAVAVVSGLALIFVERAPAAAGLVSAFGLAAEPAVAVASDLALIFFEHVPAAVVFAVAFVLAAFHADHVFVLFARPAVLAAHRPLC